MSYHFIGIGGIGMSSLAKLLLQNNIDVKGSDASSSDILLDLIKKGAKIFSSHSPENIQDNDIVVYSSAINEDNPELIAAKSKKLKILHRSDLLKNLLGGSTSLLIAGTHGKTSTTSLLTEVCIDADLDPTYSIGGILSSSNTNAYLGEGDYFIAEADESDGSFLNYLGDGAIILNVEKDHLNYWGDLNNLKKGFSDFVSNIKREDLLFWCHEDESLREMNLKGESFGFSKKADIYADNIKEDGFQMVFDINYRHIKYEGIRLNLIGRHNILNALSVFLLAKKIGVSDISIFRSFNTFQGVKRRMEKIGEVNKTIFFEDYAHHPTAIKAVLSALRKGVKERRIISVFQPHRYTRTKEQFDGFVSSFTSSDELIITDIYAAGEEDKQGVSSSELADKIKKDNKKCHYVSKSQLSSFLRSRIRPHDVVIFFGAGDISQIGKDVFKAYKQNPSRLKVALIYGGNSVEHEVSKVSAKSIYENISSEIYDIELIYIDEKGWWKEVDEKMVPQKGGEALLSSKVLKKILDADICFPVLHGPCGEDGMIQGFLDTLNVAYVGCSYQACSCSMNKAWVKYIAIQNRINTASFIEVKKALWEIDKSIFIKNIKQQLPLPLFLKPSHLGSSIGVKKINTFDDMEKEIDLIFSLDDSLIVEQGIDGQEVEVAVIGNDFVEAAVPGEVLTNGMVYDYECKYSSSAFSTIVPANIPSEKLEEVKKVAIKLYKLIGCHGMARIDFFYKDGELFLNEINPIPGFTKISLYPKMWSRSGVNYTDLIDRLLVLGLHKKALRV